MNNSNGEKKEMVHFFRCDEKKINYNSTEILQSKALRFLQFITFTLELNTSPGRQKQYRYHGVKADPAIQIQIQTQ